MGHRDEGLAERKLAQELDPLSPVINFEYGLAFYYSRDYDKAIEQLKKTLELDPNFPPAQQFLSAAYGQKGMYSESIAGFKNAIASWSGNGNESGGGSEWSYTVAGLGYVYAVTGQKEEARAVLEQLKRLSEQHYVAAPSMALICDGLGDKDQAFAWLEKAYGERAFQLQWLNIEPRWDNLRSDPRFADLVRRVGLPQ